MHLIVSKVRGNNLKKLFTSYVPRKGTEFFMEDNKKVILSGKLSGTRTFISDLENIKNPDDIEKFLLYFSMLKIDTETSYEVKYINDDEDLSEVNNYILESKYIGLYAQNNFSKLYITTDSNKTFVIRLNKVSNQSIGNYISKETPIKYALNSFQFIKWCNSKNIEIKSLYDIPTYIKLLTNDVDPFKTPEDYLKQYTNYVLEENNNDKNSIILCNFIYNFGRILAEHIDKFDLTTVSKLINENSYYEGNTFNNTGNCTIKISHTNINAAISSITKYVANRYKSKAYIVSPLNRIAPKFKRNINDLIYEIYSEDLSITILNELYNNNIPVQLDYDNNQYLITCKYKNFSNIITILNAIFLEAFVTIFDQTPEIKIECNIKE